MRKVTGGSLLGVGKVCVPHVGTWGQALCKTALSSALSIYMALSTPVIIQLKHLHVNRTAVTTGLHGLLDNAVFFNKGEIVIFLWALDMINTFWRLQ